MYKCGDKIVFKIDEHDAHDLNNGYDPSFLNGQLLGRLEDLTPAEEKIQMTIEEKKEFDKLKKCDMSLFSAFTQIMGTKKYPNLYNRLFTDNYADCGKAQLDFSKVWDKLSRIEVEKRKKYYVHLFKSQWNGYLNQNRDSLGFLINDNSETDQCKTQFTKDEIENLKDLGFKINDDALEEVEDE